MYYYVIPSDHLEQEATQKVKRWGYDSVDDYFKNDDETMDLKESYKRYNKSPAQQREIYVDQQYRDAYKRIYDRVKDLTVSDLDSAGVDREVWKIYSEELYKKRDEEGWRY